MTKIDAGFLGLQLEYSRWASERSVAAARALSEEELTRDLGASYGGVLGTLVHLYQAERIWLSRLKGAPRFTLADEGESWSLETLTREWQDTASAWNEWLAVTGDLQRNLQYVNLAGKSLEIPIWQVVLHVVNHATYHRGQITTMFRQLGYAPVATDLHIFYMSR